MLVKKEQYRSVWPYKPWTIFRDNAKSKKLEATQAFWEIWLRNPVSVEWDKSACRG